MEALLGLLSVISLGGFFVCLIGYVIKSIKKGDSKKSKLGMLLFAILFVVTMVVGTALTGPEEENEVPVEEKVEKEKESDVESDGEINGLSFLDDLTEYGYTANQIADMKAILINVGVTEILKPEIGVATYGMQTISGLAYEDRDKAVEIQLTIENGVLFYVHIYCPSYYHENQIPYLSGLEDRRAELYYDTKGGYLKKIDWENRIVIDY